MRASLRRPRRRQSSAHLLAALLCACGGTTEVPITGTRARFDLRGLDAATADFYALPFPSDLRRDGVGLALAGFPNPEASALLDAYLAALHDSVVGFGASSPLYVGFDGAIDPASLPQTPAASLAHDSSVQLIDLDQASGSAGARTPLEVKYFDQPTLFVAAHTLAVRPVPGTPLFPGHKYALVVFGSVRDVAGKPVVADDLTRRALGRWESNSPASDKAIAITAPFLLWAHRTQFPVDSVSLVSVFTVQDTTGVMAKARAQVQLLVPPAATGLAALPDSAAAPHLHAFAGRFPVSNFQQGDPPYLAKGGGFVYDGQGYPLPQRTESVRFALTLPRGRAPSGGFPIVLYAHGTGGSYLSCLQEGLADDLASRGVATLTMDQVLHGPRNPGCDENAAGYGSCVGTAYFNFINLYAGRDNGRQGGIDLFQLVRLAHTLQIPSGLHPEGLTAPLDAGHLAFLGHSQGGLTGAPFLAAESELKGAALSGTGGVLAITILKRIDPINFKQLAEQLLGIFGKEELEPFHPVLALVQTFIEPADPINYARHFQQVPLNGSNMDLLLTEGLLDPYTVPETSEALGAAALLDIGGAAVHQGPAFALLGLRVLPLPLSGNVALPGGKRVGALLQFPDDGHFAIFDNRQARCNVMGFLTSSLAGAATVSPCP